MLRLTPGQGRWATVSGFLVATADEDPAYAVVPDEGPLVPVTGTCGTRRVTGSPSGCRCRRRSTPSTARGGHARTLQAWGRPLAAAGDSTRRRWRRPRPRCSTPCTSRARPTTGHSSMSDAQVLDELGMVTEYWVDEADGRIAGFDLPDSAATGPVHDVRRRRRTVAEVCSFGGESSFFALAEEAAALFPQAGSPARGHRPAGRGDAGPGGVPGARRRSVAPASGSGFSSGGVAMARGGAGRVSGALAHELGHNFGFEHSNIGDDAVPQPLQRDGRRCRRREPAHRPEHGLSGRRRHRRARRDPDRRDPGSHRSPSRVTETSAPRTAEDGQRALAVTPPDTGKTFYVEYRSGPGPGCRVGVRPRCRPQTSYVFRPGVVVEEIWRDAGHGVSLLPDRENSWRTATIDGRDLDQPQRNCHGDGGRDRRVGSGGHGGHTHRLHRSTPAGRSRSTASRRSARA